MRTIEGISTSKNPVVVRWTRYLNGKLGKSVLENLDDGESFILQTSEHTLRVTKRKGKAIVSLIDLPLT
ncbi:MAG: hypothetical protein ACW97A_02320 [Candidatus Thorarchaeota archaeon]|jgi:hypothetical protein